jgi:hypothetical protein
MQHTHRFTYVWKSKSPAHFCRGRLITRQRDDANHAQFRGEVNTETQDVVPRPQTRRRHCDSFLGGDLMAFRIFVLTGSGFGTMFNL